MLHSFSHALQHQLTTHPLPGFEAHYAMAAGKQRWAHAQQNIPPHARLGAVLILFYQHPTTHQLTIPLTLRHAYPGVHGGQVSFPGGKWESADPSLSHTALRETHEEIGIEPSQVQLLGALSPLYIVPSNFLVHPFIGVAHTPLTFHADPAEVAELIETPIAHFYNTEVVKEMTIDYGQGISFTAPYYDVSNQRVWGATAMIINELLQILHKTPIPHGLLIDVPNK